MTGVLSCGLLVAAAAATAASRRSRTRLVRLVGGRTTTETVVRLLHRVRAQAEVSRRLAVAGTACAAAGLALIGYGPVAAVVAGAYAGLAVHAVFRRRAAIAERRALTGALDGVAALVADLRAGLTPGLALSAAMPLLIGAPVREAATATVDDLGGHLDTSPRGRVLRRLTAGWRLAETTGAPLADVLDRLDAEVRGGERARALAAAHAASARATATLLAGLPLAGVVLGYGIGADPVAVLFGTPVGGACAVGAVALQLAGLAWAQRLSQIDPERVEPTEVMVG
ncbi:MAG: type II secretion system F family protein [Micromonosporaceae bacterium]